VGCALADCPSVVEMESKAAIEMQIISLNYHDVITPGDPEPTGRVVPGAWRYNLEQSEFVRHLAAIAAGCVRTPVTVADIAKVRDNDRPVLFTFDDGGISAYRCIGDLLEKFGWRGNFFISTNEIGKPGFVGPKQICALRKRGHVIGSHSCSHPERMSQCSWAQLVEEWATSIRILSDILGEQVCFASVPGGYYSRRVAEAAALAGIKVLFNSEPVASCRYVDGCMVLGRYTVYRGTPASAVAAMAAGRKLPRLRQLVFWKCKELAKRIGGEAYLRIRKQLVTRAQQNEPCLEAEGLSSSE